MKKFTVAILLALLLFATVFTAVQAKDTEMVTISIRNKTNAPVTIEIKGVGVFTLIPGVNILTVPAGKYDFYVASSCGNGAGNVKLAGGDKFLVSCNGDGEGQALNVSVKPIEPPACGTYMEWWHYAIGPDGQEMWGHWHPLPPGTEPPDFPGEGWELRCYDGNAELPK